jgi:hypothetical protein
MKLQGFPNGAIGTRYMAQSINGLGVVGLGGVKEMGSKVSM